MSHDRSARASALSARPRSTRQAAVVDQILRDADGFRTAQEVFAEARRQGDRIGLTTVYRHLNLLAGRGSADVVHRSDGEAQYRLCGGRSETERRHHHHLICRACGRSVEISGPEVERWAEHVAVAAGFTEVTHTVEVFGLCPQDSVRLAGRPPGDP